jgi:hypothetical protein
MSKEDTYLVLGEASLVRRVYVEASSHNYFFTFGLYVLVDDEGMAAYELLYEIRAIEDTVSVKIRTPVSVSELRRLYDIAETDATHVKTKVTCRRTEHLVHDFFVIPEPIALYLPLDGEASVRSLILGFYKQHVSHEPSPILNYNPEISRKGSSDIN